VLFRSWDEKLRDIIVEVVNDRSEPISLRVKVFIRFFDKIIKNLFEKDLQVQPNRALEVFGPHTEQVDRKTYREKGKYFVIVRVNSLMDEDKGVELDEEKQAFYVEKNTPETGLFEKGEPISTNPEWMGTTEQGEEGGWKLIYNVHHPSYLANEDKLERQIEYLFRLLAFGICKIDLSGKSQKLIKDTKGLDPAQLAEKIFDSIGKIMHLYDAG